jgi:hypothetical protein
MGESFQKTAVNLEAVAFMGTSGWLPRASNTSDYWKPQGNGSEAVCISPSGGTCFFAWLPVFFSKILTGSLSRNLTCAWILMNDPHLNKVRQVINGFRRLLLRLSYLFNIERRFILFDSISHSPGSWNFDRLRLFAVKNTRAARGTWRHNRDLFYSYKQLLSNEMDSGMTCKYRLKLPRFYLASQRKSAK